MRSSLKGFFGALIVMACLCSSNAQSARQIKFMKLLSADTGWVATDNKLFWTTDGGRNWKDITPKIKADREIASAFFLDPSHGWVLFAHQGKENPATGIAETFFELAVTTDVGETWIVKQLEVPDPDPSRGLSEETWLDFVDAAHGWVGIRVNGNTAMNGGVLQATDDGGATWKSLGVPGAGPIRYITPTDGWLDDAEENAETAPGLFVTRNGGKDWMEVTVKTPPEFGAKIYPTYRLPEFSDKDSGSLLVTFAEPNDESPKLALFLTKDGGDTWILRGSANQGLSDWQTAYGQGYWIALGCPGRVAVCSRNGGGIRQVSFVNGTRGWALLSGGVLAATTDGGATWNSITPPRVLAARPLHGKAVQNLSPRQKTLQPYIAAGRVAHPLSKECSSCMGCGCPVLAFCARAGLFAAYVTDDL